MNKKYILVIAIVLIAFSSALGAEPNKTVATIDKDGVQKVDIIGGSYFFKPDDIVLKVNTPVELKVSKESGIIPHDIVAKSPEAGIEFKVELSTDPKTIEFTPTKVGTYPFYCDKKFLFFESHRDKGMKGVFEVVS